MGNITVWDILFQLFKAIMSVISANYLFTAFANKHKPNKYIALLCIVMFFLASTFIEIKPIRLLLLVICIFLFTFQFDMNLFYRILFTLLCISLSTVVELVIAYIIMAIFSINLNTIENGMLNYVGSMMSKFAEILLFFSIKAVKHFIIFKKFSKDWIGIYLLPVSILMVHFNVYYSMKFYSDNKPLMNISLISLMLLIVSNLFIIQLIDNMNKSIIREYQLSVSEQLIKQQSEQYKLLFDNNERVIKLRHDYKNFIIAILSEITDGKYDDAKDTLRSQLNLLSSDSGTTLCGDSVIDAVMNYKTAYAKDQGISVEFEYRNLHNIKFPAVDLSIVLGNAIDNAIEATLNIPDETKRVIHVYIYNTERQLMIYVKNNVVENVSISSIEETTKEDKLLHGYGILNMRQIAQKYNGAVTFKCENNVFNTAIILTNGAK